MGFRHSLPGDSLPRFLWVLSLLSSIALLDSSASAQITPDETLGTERSRIISERIREIDSDRVEGGALRGRNLFHSFREFNVPEGRGVYFSNPTGVDNIFSRVTGDNPTNILGRLGVLGEANLYLLNPNGILFGQNASLDVQGSFMATTASAFQFGEFGSFSAIAPTSPAALLTINPSAFLFNQIGAGGIEVRSTAPAGVDLAGVATVGLRVGDGETLSLLGGSVALNGGRVNALGGRVEIGAVADQGVIAVQPNGRFQFPEGMTRADVALTNQAGVHVAAGGGGAIAIQARNINLLGGSRLTTGILAGFGGEGVRSGDINLNATGTIQLRELSQITANLQGQGNAGNVILQADGDVLLAGIRDDPRRMTTVQTRVEEGAIGNGGNIRIVARSLSALNGARLNTVTFGQGNAGNINIRVIESLRLRGTDLEQIGEGLFAGTNVVASSIAPEARGNAGDVRVTARNIVIANGATLASVVLGRGDGGDMLINAAERISLNDGAVLTQIQGAGSDKVQSAGIGNGGDIHISASFVSVSGISSLSTSNTLNGIGNGGNLYITADNISMTGNSVFNASSDGRGNAGNIAIDARDSVMIDGSTSRIELPPMGILTFAFSEATDNSNSETARGGNITIDTSHFHITNGATIDARTGTDKPGGNVTIRADTFTATNGGQINTGTSNAGQAGNIILDIADQLTLSGRDPLFDQRVTQFGGSQLSRSQSSASRVIELFTEGRGRSGIFANTRSGSTGDGGRITINTANLTLEEGATISARSQGTGQAGQIQVMAPDTMRLINGDITTSAREATGGNIAIDTGNLFLTGNSNIRTSVISGIGSGCNVNITAEHLRLYNDSDIQTNVLEARGDGGNITFDVDSAVLFDDSDVIASANRGRGGDIVFDTPALFVERGLPVSPETTADHTRLDRNDRTNLDATGQLSSGTIATPDTNAIQNSLTALSEGAIDPNQILSNSCIARDDETGTFLITGSGGLPTRPGDVRVSSYATGEVRNQGQSNTALSSTSVAVWQVGDEIKEPQGVYQLNDGRIVMARECERAAMN